ncbi:glutamate--cysteine ligase [Gammaproteobacteria bacterium]|nr:glutamate--cysteine ligase [Gammaproteobacteria bacterium]
MGQEIESSNFTDAELEKFKHQLAEETRLLKSYFDQSLFTKQGYKAGFELEGWLLDNTNHAAPDNDAFLASLNDKNVVPELATFNFEVNGDATILTSDALERMYRDLLKSWRHCAEAASSRDEKILMIGILPHLRESDLNMDNMSSLSRCKALNHQILKMRDFKPLHLHITGKDEMDTLKNDVMLEAATTSFQIHFQIPLEQSVNIFNATQIASAPMVAISANSPYLFGKDLWDETRIPLFEKSVEIGGPGKRRVCFGYGYLEQSLMECFAENLAEYPALLPLVNDAPAEKLAHLKFHNGTIWRWNRPLIDFDKDNQPHLRIEHRVVPAGPSIADCFANAAFYYGLSHGLSLRHEKVADCLAFDAAKNNFYECARYGLNASVIWTDGRELNVRDLIIDELIPLATEGLEDLGIDDSNIKHWLGIILGRAESQQNGASWQRAWVAKHGHDMQAMVNRYYELQQTEQPVHEWTLL